MSVEAPLEATPPGGGFDLTPAAGVAERARPLHRRDARARTRTELAAVAATILVPVLGLLLCVAGTRTTELVPASVRPIPQSMAGPFYLVGISLSSAEVTAALVVMLAAYLFAVWHADSLSARTVIWAIVAFNVIVLLGPPLFSTDVFSYQAYGRMFAVDHINPYMNGPYAIHDDQLYNYIGQLWINTPSVYGPLFTFISGVFASASIAFSEFAFKLIAAAASAGTLWLIWRASQRRGVNPVRGIALFGLSPVVTLSGVGGAHNDLLMLFLTTAGVYAILTSRERAAGALMAAGAALKLTAGVLLPFALLSGGKPGARARWRAYLHGAVAVTVVIAAASFATFGIGILHLPGTLQTVQDQGTWQSLLGSLFSLAGLSVPAAVRIVVGVALAAVVLRLLWEVWNERMDWLLAAAWATVAVLVTAWSVLPWYVSWLMPLVALCSSRRLWTVALVLTALAGAMMIGSTFPSG